MDELSRLFRDNKGKGDNNASNVVAHDDRRDAIRIAQNELESSFGRVLDISVSGMRVVCRHVPKDEQVEFQLNTTVDPITVIGKIVWTQRLGFRKHEVGLHFINASKELINLVHRCSTLDGRVRVETNTSD